MKKIIFLLTSLMILSLNAQSNIHDSKKDPKTKVAPDSSMNQIEFKRHAIYVYGGYNVISLTGGLNYEYTFKQSTKSIGFNYYAGASFAYSYILSDSYYCFRVIAGLYIGKYNHHLDIALGVNLGFTKTDPYVNRLDFEIMYGAPIYGGVFYRYQKPGGHFMLKTGLSFPDGLSVGFGFAL